MNTHSVKVKNNIIIVDSGFLADFFGRNKNTIRGWKNSKNMPVYETDDKGVNYFNLVEVIAWVKINISEKFNHNKSKTINAEEDDDFELNLPYGLEIAEIDLDNSLHLAILVAHPMGELIRDTLEFRSKQIEKDSDIEKKNFELRVRKKEFLKTEELNIALSETMSMVKDVDINARSKFPIEIVEELLNEGYVEKKDKEKIQKLISGVVDKHMKEKYKIIASQFMKHTVKKTKEVTLKFLDEMKELIKKGESDE